MNRISNGDSLVIILCKTLMLPLLYGAKARTLLSPDAAVLSIRKSFCPVRVGYDFRIRSNKELYKLFNDMDAIQCTNIQRQQWLRHVVRM